MKDEKYIPGEEKTDVPAEEIKKEEAPENVTKEPPENEVPENTEPHQGDEPAQKEEVSGSGEEESEKQEDSADPQTENKEESAENPTVTDDEAADEEAPVDEYAIEDEPFVRRASPAEIAYYTQRITGEEHSLVTTAAPVRTRNPDQNRNVTNGIPQRGAAQHQRISHPIQREPLPKKKSGVLPMVVAAALLVAAMLGSVVVGVNLAYAEKADTRPSDFDMTEKEYENSVNLDSLSEKPETDPPLETDEDTDTEPAEPETETAEPEQTDTEPVETEPAVTEPPVTEPPETEPPSPQYTIKLDFFDRDDIVVSAQQTTLRNLLDVLGITLAETDRPNVDLDAVLAADTTVRIDQVLYKSVTVTEAMPYQTEVIEIDTIPRGNKNYLQYGTEGSKNLYYTVEYINGQEINRTKDWEEVTQWPVNEKYELGVGGSFVGADGVTYTYSLRRVVPATYYDIYGPTWLGPDAGEWCIAVDFDYIPLGTELYVKNAKYDFGLRTAADTGSAIQEWEIDIWIGPDNPQLADFAFTGYHYDMEIYYVD